jgi:hypothetical protein
MSRRNVVTRTPVLFSRNAIEVLFNNLRSPQRSVAPAHGEIMADRAVCVDLVEEGFLKNSAPQPNVPRRCGKAVRSCLSQILREKFLGNISFPHIEPQFLDRPYPIDIDSKGNETVWRCTSRADRGAASLDAQRIDRT